MVDPSQDVEADRAEDAQGRAVVDAMLSVPGRTVAA